MEVTLKLATLTLLLAVVNYPVLANNNDESECNKDLQKRVENLELELRQIKQFMERKLDQDNCPCDLTPLSKILN